MKRSEINSIIKNYEGWIASMSFHLPPWAHWTLEQ
ncbi:MAG: D-lyxose/D-mannose family sugar isomerase, partial [Spirochaetales bacterium]|nr:D-lyxose/D-mannose family sugar isomerase [Spirochaetales bacterium]